jgi:hypothetical protein
MPAKEHRNFLTYTVNSFRIFPKLKTVYVHQLLNIVTHMPIARQWLGKHISNAYALSNRTSIARKRTNKHAFLTTEDGVFRGVCAEEGTVCRCSDQN